MPGHARRGGDPPPAVRSRCSLIAVVVVLVLGCAQGSAAAQVGVSIVFRLLSAGHDHGQRG